MHAHDATGQWTPFVSLKDGIRAVAIGLQATRAIVNNSTNAAAETTAGTPSNECLCTIAPSQSIQHATKYEQQ